MPASQPRVTVPPFVRELMPTRPVIKWVGGKGRLLGELVARMPPTYKNYLEPFAGGAALFFAVAPTRAILGDTNADLIGLYRVIADAASHPPLFARLNYYEERHSETRYYRARTQWNRRDGSEIERAALFIYLNRTCFNGVWRVNKSGEMNVPIGRYDDPKVYEPAAIKAAAPLLARATLCIADYQQVVTGAHAGDFVYFDPPYDPIDATSSFTGYAAGGFTRAHQKELATCARDLVKRGCFVMISNNDTPLIRRLYRGFHIDRVACGRSISSKITKRGSVSEVIIMGGYRPPTMAAIDEWSARAQMPRDQFMRLAAAHLASEMFAAAATKGR